MVHPLSDVVFIRRGKRALRRMSPLQKEIFLTMRHEDGVTYAILAQRHDISEEQVMQEFSRALVILTTCVEEPESWWKKLSWRLG